MYSFTQTLFLLVALAPSDAFSPSWRTLTTHHHRTTLVRYNYPRQDGYYDVPNEDGEDRWGIPSNVDLPSNQGGYGVPPPNNNMDPRASSSTNIDPISRVPRPPNPNYTGAVPPNMNPQSPYYNNPNYASGGEPDPRSRVPAPGYNPNQNPNVDPWSQVPRPSGPNYSSGGAPQNMMDPYNANYASGGGNIQSSGGGPMFHPITPDSNSNLDPKRSSAAGGGYNQNQQWSQQVPNQSYGGPNPSYGGPNPSYGAPDQSYYGAPDQSYYGAPNPATNNPSQWSQQQVPNNPNYTGGGAPSNNMNPNPSHNKSGPSFNPITPSNESNLYSSSSGTTGYNYGSNVGPNRSRVPVSDNPSHNTPDLKSRPAPVDDVRDYSGKDKWGLPKVDPLSREPSNNPNQNRPHLNLRAAPEYKYAFDEDLRKNFVPNNDPVEEDDDMPEDDRDDVPRSSDNPSHNAPDLKTRPSPVDEVRDYSGTDKWGLPKVDPLSREPSNNPNKTPSDLNSRPTPQYKYAFDDDYLPEDDDGRDEVLAEDVSEYDEGDLEDDSRIDMNDPRIFDPLAPPSNNPNYNRAAVIPGQTYKDNSAAKHRPSYLSREAQTRPSQVSDPADFVRGSLNDVRGVHRDLRKRPSQVPDPADFRSRPGGDVRGIHRDQRKRPSQVSNPADFVRSRPDGNVRGVHRDQRKRPSQVSDPADFVRGSPSEYVGKEDPLGEDDKPLKGVNARDVDKDDSTKEDDESLKQASQPPSDRPVWGKTSNNPNYMSDKIRPGSTYDDKSAKNQPSYVAANRRTRPSQISDPAEFVRGSPIGDADDEPLEEEDESLEDVSAKDVEKDTSSKEDGESPKQASQPPSDRPVWGKTSNNPNYISDKIRPGTTYDDKSAKNQPSYVSANRRTRPSQISDPAEFVRGSPVGDIEDEPLEEGNDESLEDVNAKDVDKDDSLEGDGESKVGDSRPPSDRPVWGKTSNNPNYVSDKIRPGSTYDDKSAKNQPSYLSANRQTRPSQVSDPADFVRNAQSNHGFDNEDEGDSLEQDGESPKEKDLPSPSDPVLGEPSDNPNYNRAQVRPGSTYGSTSASSYVSPQSRPRPSQAIGNPDYHSTEMRTGPSYSRDFSSDNPSYSPTNIRSRRGPAVRNASSGSSKRDARDVRGNSKCTDSRGIIQPDGMRGVSNRRSPADSIQSRPIRPYTGRAPRSDDISQKDYNRRDVRSRPDPVQRAPASPGSQKGHNARDIRSRPDPWRRSSSDESQKGHNARDVR